MKDILIKAIHQRKYVSFTYSGLQREVQPVAVGISRAGNQVLRCYQTAGGHITSGHEWDLCELSKIQNLQTLEKIFFTNPPDYKKGDKHMTHIYAEL